MSCCICPRLRAPRWAPAHRVACVGGTSNRCSRPQPRNRRRFASTCTSRSTRRSRRPTTTRPRDCELAAVRYREAQEPRGQAPVSTRTPGSGEYGSMPTWRRPTSTAPSTGSGDRHSRASSNRPAYSGGPGHPAETMRAAMRRNCARMQPKRAPCTWRWSRRGPVPTGRRRCWSHRTCSSNAR